MSYDGPRLTALAKQLREEHEEKVRAAFEEYQTNPMFHARVHLVAADLSEHGDIPEPDPDMHRELCLGLALRAIVAYEASARQVGLP